MPSPPRPERPSQPGLLPSFSFERNPSSFSPFSAAPRALPAALSRSVGSARDLRVDALHSNRRRRSPPSSPPTSPPSDPHCRTTERPQAGLLTRLVDRAGAPFNRDDLRSLTAHWAFLLSCLDEYSEKERLQALLVAAPPLAARWTDVHCCRKTGETEREYEERMEGEMRELGYERWEVKDKLAKVQGKRPDNRAPMKDDALCRLHDLEAELYLVEKKLKYLRASCPWAVPPEARSHRPSPAEPAADSDRFVPLNRGRLAKILPLRQRREN